MSKPTALVTGGASGIGLATTKYLLDKGWKVVIVDLNKDVGTKLTEELGGDVSFFYADVTAYADQIAMFKHTFSWGGGRLDLFAANAGIVDTEDIFAKTQVLDDNGYPKELDLKTMDVDLTAVIQGCWIYKHFARKNAIPGGKIVITSSVGGIYPSPINAQYCTAKAACVHLARCLGSAFLQNENITVNAICPSFIMTALSPPELHAIFPKEQITPMATALKAYEMILDDDSMTGQVLELSIERVILRKPTEYATENQRWLIEDAMAVWRVAYGDKPSH